MESRRDSPFSLLSLKQLSLIWGIRIIGSCLSFSLLSVACIAWLFSGKGKQFWKPKTRTSIPAALRNIGRHSYVQLESVKLHYVETGDRKKPLLLLLHGFPDFWFIWKNQLQAFSKTHWVVAVDMRGYGDSEKPQGADQYQIPILVEDIRQLIIKLNGKKTCVLMGHDWGGIVGWVFAATYPNMLTHFIALNIPHPSVFRQFLTSSPKQMLLSWYMYFFQIPWIAELIIGSNDNKMLKDIIIKSGLSKEQNLEEEIEAYKYCYSQPGAWSGPLNYYRRVFHPQSCLWMSDEQLRVRIPTLLVFGKNDVALDYRMVPECANHVDNFQYRIVEGASHWVQRDQPDHVNSIVSQFLEL